MLATPAPPATRFTLYRLHTRSGCIPSLTSSDGFLFLGFDDGTILYYNVDDLRDGAAAGHVTYDTHTVAGERGLVDGKRGCPSAALFTYYKGQATGLLVGRCPESLFGESMYTQHHIIKYEEEKTERQTRSGDRLGLHTFTCGDSVRYTGGEDDAEAVEAWVVGLVSKPKVGSSQARKYLILCEANSEIIFVASCTQWRRISADPSSDLDPEHKDFKPKFVSTNDIKCLWDKSDKLAHIKNIDQAEYYAKKPPPHVAHLRKLKKAEESVAEKAEKQRLQKEARDRKAAAKGGAKGGRAGRGSAPPRNPLPMRDPPAPPTRDTPPHDDLSPRRSPRQHQTSHSPSPPGSVKAVKKQLRMLKAAQAFDGTAQRAGEIEGLQTDLEERERKYRKYGRW